MCNCLRNTFGSEIRSVAVEMSDMLEQCKEVVEEMTRKVVEFVENNMGMVEDNLGQVGNNLEESWDNLVEEYFGGDNVAALQVNCPNPKPLKTHHTEDSPSRHHHHNQPHCRHHPDVVSKVVGGAIILLISLPFYWLPLPCRQHQSMKCFPFIFSCPEQLNG